MNERQPNSLEHEDFSWWLSRKTRLQRLMWPSTHRIGERHHSKLLVVLSKGGRSNFWGLLIEELLTALISVLLSTNNYQVYFKNYIYIYFFSVKVLFPSGAKVEINRNSWGLGVTLFTPRARDVKNERGLCLYNHTTIDAEGMKERYLCFRRKSSTIIFRAVLNYFQ